MTIRKATLEDMPQLMAMGEQFAQYAPYDVEYSAASTEQFLIGLWNMGGVTLVSEVDGRIAGAICGAISPVWYAPSTRIAGELAWWVDPNHRGGRHAIGLVKAFEQWAKDNGASFVSLCDMRINGDYPAGPLFERMGYHTAERTHTKEI